MAHLDDKYAQSDVQFALLPIVLADQNLLTINTVKNTTHTTI